MAKKKAGSSKAGDRPGEGTPGKKPAASRSRAKQTPEGSPGTPKGNQGRKKPASGSGTPSSRASRGGRVEPAADLKPVPLDPVVRALENLRKHRVRPEARRAIGEVVREEQTRLTRTRKATEGFAEAWEKVAPPHLRDRAWPLGVMRRVLRLGVEDAPTGYELSLWLRAGGETALCVEAKWMIGKVKVEVVGGQKTNST